MFKILVLQHLYNLADEQTEYQIRDRYSFCRFLDIAPEGNVPDARTIWVFREALKEHELIDELFAQLNGLINTAGYIPRQGQIVDARWTMKHGKTHYGYKNHISIDRKHKLVHHFEVTPASVHDSQVFDVLLDDENRSADVWADSAYRSQERELTLKALGYRSHLHTKGRIGKPVSDCQQRAHRRRSRVRSRVEHIFGAQQAMGGKLVRTIGLARARFKIGMSNLVYNLRRWCWLSETGV